MNRLQDLGVGLHRERDLRVPQQFCDVPGSRLERVSASGRCGPSRRDGWVGVFGDFRPLQIQDLSPRSQAEAVN